MGHSELHSKYHLQSHQTLDNAAYDLHLLSLNN